MELGDGVAKAIADYVYHFFTCRHCADHFGEEIQKNKVESQNNNTFPVWPSDAVFWMWKLHNMANIRLKGEGGWYSKNVINKQEGHLFLYFLALCFWALF